MTAIQKALARVRAKANAGVAQIGYLVAMFKKSLSVHVTYEDYLRQLHGNDAFRAVILLAKDYKEAVTFREPVVE
jgi:chromosome partitioning protein